MPEMETDGIFGDTPGSALDNRELSSASIAEALFSALSFYFEPIRNKKKCQKAVNRIAKSIAEDLNRIKFKREDGAPPNIGILKSLFTETGAALLLDSFLNPRPAYQIESREQCYLQWVEIYIPLGAGEAYRAVLKEAFRLICRQFEGIKTFFNANELQKIYVETERRIVSLYAAPDRRAPENGSFLEYIKKLSQFGDLALKAETPTAPEVFIKPEPQKPEPRWFDRYSGFKLPFMERGGELQELKKFCFSEKRLSWWSVSGGGGIGKSRLAYELCRFIRGNRKTWYCVFLSNEFYDDLERFKMNWSLDRNLLAVIDYPNFNIEKIGKWIKQLVESNTVNKKIRLLILEREGADTNPEWFKRFMNAAGERASGILCHGEGFAPLRPSALDYTDYINIVEMYGYDNHDIGAAKLRIMDMWMKFDPRFLHPSVLSMIVTAVENNFELPECTELIQFLDALYEREIGRIYTEIDAVGREDPVFVAVLLSLAFAAIVSIVDPRSDYTRQICVLAGLDENSPYVQKVVDNIIKICGVGGNSSGGGRENNGGVGGGSSENSGGDSGGSGGENSSGDSGGGGGASLGGLDGRALLGGPDLFCEYFALKTLVVFSGAKNYSKAIMRMAWDCNACNAANFLYRAIDDCCDEYNLNELKPILDLLHILPEKPNHVTAALLGELLVYLSASQDAAGTSETAAQLEKLRGRGFDQDGHTAFRLMTVYYRMFLHHDTKYRKEMVTRMDDLRNQGFEYDRDMALILAQSMFILSVKQDEDGIKNTVARLEDLRSQGFEQDRAITLELIKTLLNLTAKQDEAGRKNTVERMETLRSQGFEGDRDITLELTKALLNLSIKQDEAEIENTVLRIEALRNSRFGNDKDMALVLAQSLLNLSTKQDEAGIANTVERLEALRNQGFEDDRDITLELSTALFNLTTRQEAAGIKKTVERLEELRAGGFTADRDITLRLAQALFNLTAKQGAAVRKEASARIDALRGQGFEQDREITLALVKSLYNLTIEQDSEGTKETVERIEEICESGYAQDKEIKLLFAKSLYNMTTKLDESGVADAVSRLETLRGEK